MGMDGMSHGVYVLARTVQKTECYEGGRMDAQEELEALRAKVAKLEAEKGKVKEISLKVSEKEGLSVYGLKRFPVTLYKEQWVRLLDHADAVREFLDEHDDELKAKGE